MFAIYNEHGRYFRNTLEELYKVESIAPLRGLKQLVSDEQDDQQNKTNINNDALNAYRQVIHARREEPIYHASQIMKRSVITVPASTTTTAAANATTSKSTGD